VSFAAVTPGGAPLVGASVRAVLHRLVPRGAAAPTEERLEAWALRTNAEGRGAVSLKALRAGQYRLSVTITDGRDRDVETAALFTARGDDDPGNDFRFNDLEIVLDRRTHAPGERARLLINTAQPGGAVWLFVRPVNGIYERPEVVRLDGRSALREVPLAAADSPNIFVEAVTVRDGRVFTETREILLPPESRALTVEVKPVASTVKPGETAKARVRLTDAAGRPVRGSLTLAVYDKSVEYISGGSNVADIREFFWKWRRSHTPGGRSAFDRWDRSFPLKDRPGMGPLGVFGAAVQDEFQEMDKDRLREGGVAGGAALRKAAAPAATRSGVSTANAAADAAAPEEESRAVSPGVEPTVRSRFADTALWVGRVDTDARGESTVSFKAPDNLTTWKTRAWAVSDGARVGEGTAEIVTAKKLLVRLQTPRFLGSKGRGGPERQRAQLFIVSKGRAGVAGFGGGHPRIVGRRRPHGVDPAPGRSPGGLARAGPSPRADDGARESRDGRGIGRGRNPFPGAGPRHDENRILRRVPAARGDGVVLDLSRAGGAPAGSLAVGDPRFPEPGPRHGGRPALFGRLPLRVHGADAEPVPAHRHHPGRVAAAWAFPSPTCGKNGRT
jgi:hypothetical protein